MDSPSTSYLTIARKVDDKYTADDPTRPFTTVIQQNFAQGNAIPLVSGAFGELCSDGHRLVGGNAAVTAENTYITPDSIRSAKGSLLTISTLLISYLPLAVWKS